MKSLYPIAVISMIAAVTTGHVQAVGLDFDAQASGTDANLNAPVGLTIDYAAYLPLQDGFGDDIPGTEAWRVDGSAGPVLVQEPQSFYGRGAAPSPLNALDAVFQPVLLSFSTPFYMTSFSVTLDNDTFGGANESVLFYDASDSLLLSAPVDQTVAGFQLNTGIIGNVSKVVLPSGGLYDNVSAVPEPGVGMLLVGGLLVGGLRRFRRNRSAVVAVGAA